MFFQKKHAVPFFALAPAVPFSPWLLQQCFALTPDPEQDGARFGSLARDNAGHILHQANPAAVVRATVELAVQLLGQDG